MLFAISVDIFRFAFSSNCRLLGLLLNSDLHWLYNVIWQLDLLFSGLVIIHVVLVSEVKNAGKMDDGSDEDSEQYWSDTSAKTAGLCVLALTARFEICEYKKASSNKLL